MLGTSGLEVSALGLDGYLVVPPEEAQLLAARIAGARARQSGGQKMVRPEGPFSRPSSW